MRLNKLHIVALILYMLPILVKAQQCIPESDPGLVRYTASSPDAIAYTWLVNNIVAKDSVPVNTIGERIQTFDTSLTVDGSYKVSVIPISDSGVWGDTVSLYLTIVKNFSDFTMQATWTNNSLIACLRPDSTHINVNIGISLKSQSYNPGDTFTIVYTIDNDTSTKEFNTANASFNIDAINYSTSQVHNFRILQLLYGNNLECIDNYKGNPPTLALNVHNSPIVDIGSNIEVCEGQPFEFRISQPFTYDDTIWNGKLHASSYRGAALRSDTVKVLVSKNGCQSSAEALLIVHPLPKFQITNNGKSFIKDTINGRIFKKDTMLCGDETMSLKAGDFKRSYYLWANNEVSDSINFKALSPNSDSILYHMWATVTNEFGCSFSDTITIQRCIPPTENKIEMAFTPNGDGIHDYWLIPYLEYYGEAIVDVYDRWGRNVFHSEKGYKKPWDGKANGKDLPMDNYFYIIQLDKKSKPIHGYITILR